MVVAPSVDGAKKALGILKSNADAGLKFKCVAPTHDLLFVCFSNAAWAARHDSGSQGGYMIVACRPRVLNGGESECVVVDWKSFRPPAPATLDALEYVKCLCALMRDPHADPMEGSTMHLRSQSLMVIDAKALYDAAQRDGVTSLTDKRTGIEVLSLRERLSASFI